VNNASYRTSNVRNPETIRRKIKPPFLSAQDFSWSVFFSTISFDFSIVSIGIEVLLSLKARMTEYEDNLHKDYEWNR
jgi:hypothetical protein